MRAIATIMVLIGVVAARPVAAEPPAAQPARTPAKKANPAAKTAPDPADRAKRAEPSDPADRAKRAEPSAADRAKRAEPSAADRAKRAEPSDPASRPALDLGSMAAQAAASTAAVPGDARRDGVDTRRLDLTPQRQFQSGALAGQSGDRRGSERGSGVTLGDDSDWRVQAAQVGAMAAAFGALVAICGNGRCLLPDLFGGGQDELGPPPGLEIREQPALRDPR